MVENDLFRLFGVCDLAKSQGVALPSGVTPEYVIKGRIVNEVKDADGETPALDLFDWSLFDQGGFIKYEHDPFTIVKSNDKVEITSKPYPANNIGVPLKRYRKGGQMLFEGALFPDSVMAEEVVQLHESIEKHNKRFPNNRRHLQFSIEGQYGKYNPKTKRYGAKVLNIVVSPQGVDSTTFATIEKQNTAIMKSLEAGTAVAPSDMKGGEALRKQDLESSLKNLTNMRDNSMDRFTSQNEAFHVYKSRGMKDEEAKAAVKKYFADKATEEEKGDKEVEKCFTSKSESLKKSIEGSTALAALAETADVEIKKFQVDLQKSVQTLRDGKELDGLMYLGDNTSALGTIADLVKAGFVQIAKSLQSLAEAMEEDSKIQIAQRKLDTGIALDLEKSVAVQDRMVTAMRLSQKGISVSNLEEIKTDPAAPDPDKSGDGLAKSVPVMFAEKWLADKGSEFAESNPKKAEAYFAGQEQVNLAQSLSVLTKSIRDEILKDFQAQHVTEN